MLSGPSPLTGMACTRPPVSPVEPPVLIPRALGHVEKRRFVPGRGDLREKHPSLQHPPSQAPCCPLVCLSCPPGTLHLSLHSPILQKGSLRPRPSRSKRQSRMPFQAGRDSQASVLSTGLQGQALVGRTLRRGAPGAPRDLQRDLSGLDPPLPPALLSGLAGLLLRWAGTPGPQTSHLQLPKDVWAP